jgi:small redox-active disulfide protein 2
MIIKILGTGCAKCHSLRDTTKEVINEMGIEAALEEVKDMNKILEYPIMITPGLVINEELVCSGRIPKKSEIKSFVADALTKEKS